MSEEQIDATEAPAEDTQAIEENTEEVAEETEKEMERMEEGAGEPKEEVAEEPELITLKISGKEVEFTKEQVIELAQRSQGSHQKFQEAATARKQMMGLMENLKTNPFDALKKMGVNTKEAAENYLLDIMDREGMTEEQKKYAEAQDKIKQLEGDKETNDKEREAQELAASTEKWSQKWDNDITKALSASNLPKQPKIVDRAIDYILQGIDEKVPISADEAVKLVEMDIIEENVAMLKDLPQDKLEKLIGKDGVKKLGSIAASKVTSPEDSNTLDKAIQGHSQPVQKKTTWKEFTADLDAKWGKL